MSAATPLPPSTTWERLHATRLDCLLSVIAAFACGLFVGSSIDVLVDAQATSLATASAHVIDPAGVVVDNPAIAAAAKESPGVYRVLVVETGKPLATTLVTIGEAPTPPVVVPPAPPTPPVPVPPVAPPVVTKPTAATYVYEKDSTAVPSAVLAGLNRLNREKGIVATLFEEDATDGDGDVPEQYKVAVEAARRAGLPALVTTNGATVVKIVRDPKTAEQVLGAIE